MPLDSLAELSAAADTFKTAYNKSIATRAALEHYINNVEDFASRHALVVNSSLFYNSYGSPDVLSFPATTGDPIRSNLFGYWYIEENSNNAFSPVAYRMKALKQIVNMEPFVNKTEVCYPKQNGFFQTIYECSEDAFLSNKYRQAGFDINLGPADLYTGLAYKNDVDMHYIQSMIFKLDYSKMISFLEANDVALFLQGTQKVGHMMMLPKPLPPKMQNAIMYSFIASLFVDVDTKAASMGDNPTPLASTYWAATKTNGVTDESYVGYLDYAKTLEKSGDTFESTLKQLFKDTIGKYLNNKALGAAHYDYAFEVPLPTSEKASSLYNMVPMAGGQFGQGGGHVKVESVYNFYSPLYEGGLNKQMDLTVHVLPNIYAITKYTAHHAADTKHASELRDHVTLDGLVSTDAVKSSFGLKQDKENDLGPVKASDPRIDPETKQYFDLIGNKMLNGEVDGTRIAKAKNLFGHVFVSSDNLEFMKEASSYKKIFPMYIDIKFDTPLPGEFCSMLNDTDDVLEYMKALCANFFVDHGTTSKFLKVVSNTSFGPEAATSSQIGGRFLDMTFCTNVEIPAVFKSGQDTGYTLAQQNITRALDVLDFMNIKKEKAYSSFKKVFQTRGIFFGREKKPVDPISDFKEQINRIIMLGKFKKFVKKYFRSYQELMTGHKAYSETVFFRIEKIGFSNVIDGQEVVLQNFWLPNLPGVDVLNYVDTQVKYGHKYKYRIYSYNIVIGNEYSYQPLHADAASKGEFYLNKIKDITGVPVMKLETDSVTMESEGDRDEGTGGMPVGEITSDMTMDIYANKAASSGDLENADLYSIMDIETRPMVLMVEVPYYNTEVVVVDTPPLPPDMDINSYIGKNDQVKLDFNNQTGDVNLDPIFIEPGEKEQFDLIRKNQDRMLKDYDGNLIDSTIRFKSDDYADSFQIYRLDFRPSSYEDFSGNMILDLHTAQAMAYNDSVRPNKKYYYMFRSVDVHGHVSNPSHVYEVEVVSEDDVSFLLTKVIEMKDLKSKATSLTKPLNQFLSISPADFQFAFKRYLQNAEFNSAYDLPLSGDTNIFGEGLEESLFDNDKKYKVRLTSKTTGRKIDINLKFLVEHELTDKQKKFISNDITHIKLPNL